MSNYKKCFTFVIPSILAFALSGVYAIVDGFFVGNSVGDIGISTINIAYPIQALMQAAGTGIGMGGAVYFSIFRAEGKPEQARHFIAGTLWLLLLTSAVMTVLVFPLTTPLLQLLGARGEILALGEDYIHLMALGAFLQVIGTGLIPLIRNCGGAFFAMVAMSSGFITNIILDYLFVWIFNGGVAGAAAATLIGQAVAMTGGILYLLYKKQITFSLPLEKVKQVSTSIFKIGLAPFGLTLSPNFSLILINRFSSAYGGEQAIAVYACISYILTIVYLILQGVGDGIQPLMSQFYGSKKMEELKHANFFAYGFSLLLSFISIFILYIARGQIGGLFGASETVSNEVASIFFIFLLTIPFIAINRVATASFYATEKSLFSYILTYIEPVSMLIFMLVLPPLFGGQIMVWWSSTFSKILSAIFALILKYLTVRQEKIASEKISSLEYDR